LSIYMKKYPKVLIMIETFNKQSGGGITLSNLFYGWDKSCLANAVSIANAAKIENTEQCDNYYCLGKNEFKVSFPFSLYFKIRDSGKIDIPLPTKNPATGSGSKPKQVIKNAIKSSVDWIKNFFNLPNLTYSMRVSAQLLEWIDDFKPDYIYIQPSSRLSINFFKDLHQATGVPLVMHIMDDWQKALNKSSLFYKYWEKKIDKEFRELLDMTSVFLSISEGMSDEYYKRYGKKFTHFHNTIEIDRWLPFAKKDFKINDEVKILYAGRIGIGTYHSFFDFILAIEELNNEGQNISLHIQSPFVDEKFRSRLMKFKCVSFNKFVEYAALAQVFSAYDLLLLPIDFEGKGKAFLKHSMPTKVSEFMISGTPILLFSPEGITLDKHAKDHKWAYVINNNTREAIKKGVLEIITNEDLRIRISSTATDYALKHFNSNLVREQFRAQFV
jgi:glycosyltransferase involved in cell wall biosynthesis